ncbi:MAG: nucleotidyltransferase domain-containing protein [Bacteroidales bacterium]|nr:nucleotidyltransferase domain-containing protein [Bacteroidales bacterium]
MTQQEIKRIILDHLRLSASHWWYLGLSQSVITERADIDILVKFKAAPSLITLIKLENELSDLLGIKVDLITTGAIKNKRVQKSIKKDLINIL